MCIIALTNTIGLQLSVSYCIDSYRDLAGEAMITGMLQSALRVLSARNSFFNLFSSSSQPSVHPVGLWIHLL